MQLTSSATDWVHTETEENLGEVVDWDAETGAAVKAAVESCGCDGAARAAPLPLWLALAAAWLPLQMLLPNR